MSSNPENNYLCLECRKPSGWSVTSSTDQRILKCKQCGEEYIEKWGVANFLKKPSKTTHSELLGMALESGLSEN